MYFLDEEEKRLLLRRILPQARERDIAPELRGWNWDKPPLSPIYDVRLGVYEVANKYCPTNRDVYLRRVLGVKAPPNRQMVEGNLLHGLLCKMIIAAKKAIYEHGPDCLSAEDGLQAMQMQDFVQIEAESLSEEDLEEVRMKAKQLWEYEYHRLIARVQDVLARQPHIGPDALVAMALPVTVDQRLNGAFLGLSSRLAADAFVFSESMVVDIKFGSKERFHYLTTTGYALVMESLYEYPINAGCIVYASFREGRLRVERDFHFIDDELRQWFIEERDERMRMTHEEIDPGLAEGCLPRQAGRESCPFWRHCHPG
ncbi:MAG: type I-A CRISPR-associated protein Cas4/Csa1 [Chloroflexi bacterium]|nr:type I-A CRISPR-associated protein Cas4/Csa1 [Chloroflexota bacterium]